jgi:uncharacterized sulfatase
VHQVYDAEIAATDHRIGRLVHALDAAGLSEDTLVVVVADHGEGLMRRGYMQHAANINEEEVRVPMLMRWVGRIPGGSRIRAPVSLVDVAPTSSTWDRGVDNGRSISAAFLLVR